MNTLALRVVLLFVSILFFHSAIRAADTNPPLRLTVELRDGSRIVGTSTEKDFKFNSALLGEIKLNVKDIRSIECVSSNSAKLSMVNGDSLTVSFVDSEFAVKTSFGKINLQINSVRKFSVSPDGADAHPPGLVALWSGEGDGVDSIGGNTAILTDITFAQGKAGQAFSFNGTSSSIRIPASLALDVGADNGLTISAWIKPSDVDGFHPLFQWSGDGALNCAICFNSAQNGVLMGNIAEESRNHFVVSNQGVLASGVFQLAAITYDKASGLGTWYLNGVMVAQRQLGKELAVSTKGDLVISQRNHHQGDWSSNRSFAGLMDEIAIYNRALSSDEIQAMCAAENHGEPLVTPAASTGWYEDWMR